MAKKRSQPTEELSYEKAFAELEEIVRKMEKGDLSLDESLALFERGQVLAARCGKLLDTAELKVKQLVPDREGYREEDFPIDEES